MIKRSSITHDNRQNSDVKSHGRGGLVTYLSKNIVENVIRVISNLMKRKIVDEIKDAEIFSVQIDSTQDVTVTDQFSIVIRYVDSHGIVRERLVSMVKNKSSTGQAIFELLKKCLEDLGVHLIKCIGSSTDGAANMRGAYNGFNHWLSTVSAKQIHV